MDVLIASCRKPVSEPFWSLVLNCHGHSTSMLPPGGGQRRISSPDPVSARWTLDFPEIVRESFQTSRLLPCNLSPDLAWNSLNRL